jgi:hypothetical protein
MASMPPPCVVQLCILKSIKADRICCLRFDQFWTPAVCWWRCWRQWAFRRLWLNGIHPTHLFRNIISPYPQTIHLLLDYTYPPPVWEFYRECVCVCVPWILNNVWQLATTWQAMDHVRFFKFLRTAFGFVLFFLFLFLPTPQR